MNQLIGLKVLLTITTQRRSLQSDPFLIGVVNTISSTTIKDGDVEERRIEVLDWEVLLRVEKEDMFK